MARKKYTCGLSPEEIKKWRHEIVKYKDSLKNKQTSLLERLLEEGKSIAQLNIIDMDAIDTGLLAGSVSTEVQKEGVRGSIFIDSADVPYVFFVEYGTGVRGEGSPHPELPEGWVYDYKAVGYEGFQSRPFFYSMTEQLRREAPTIAKEVFNRD